MFSRRLARALFSWNERNVRTVTVKLYYLCSLGLIVGDSQQRKITRRRTYRLYLFSIYMDRVTDSLYINRYLARATIQDGTLFYLPRTWEAANGERMIELSKNFRTMQRQPAKTPTLTILVVRVVRSIRSLARPLAKGSMRVGRSL
jgi:hypothetical protein